MDAIEQPLDYPWAEPPPAESPREVAPGLFWVRMPLPFPPKHINLWLIADSAGWTIVDTGLHRDDTKAVWEAVFAGLAHRRPVTRLICTHFHPDHMGAAVWLMRRWSIDLWMTAGEWTQARAVHALGSEADIAQRVAFYREAGAGADAIGQFAQAENLYRRGVPEVPAGFRRISGGAALRIGAHDWLPIIGRGHCPEHACLWSRGQGVLIGGDILLPRITPNVGVWPSEPLANPLAQYLDCLGGFDRLPDETLVLPSHGLPYRGLQRRLAQLRAHHAEELAALLNAMDGVGLRAVDCFKLLFKAEIGPHNIGLAIGEALAHLHYLEEQGRVRRRRDGEAWRFARA
jgi:glyoxylase-like metal-dependent hydrolase (beta-lactamase superfamily II)